MDQKTLQRIWDRRLSLWLQARETERRRVATRFFLIAGPGLALGIAAGLYTLIATQSPELSGLVFGVIALPLSWLGYAPVQKLQAECEGRLRAEALSALGYEDMPAPGASFDLDEFFNLDLVFQAPGRTTNLVRRRCGETAFEMATVDLALRSNSELRYGREFISSHGTKFSGVVVRLALSTSPVERLVLTREADWFSDLSVAGGSYCANHMSLRDLTHEASGATFKAFVERGHDPVNQPSQKFLGELMALEKRFAGRPIRLAFVPGEGSGMCYIAAHSRMEFLGLSVLEPQAMERCFKGLVDELAAVIELTDAVASAFERSSPEAESRTLEINENR